MLLVLSLLLALGVLAVAAPALSEWQHPADAAIPPAVEDPPRAAGAYRAWRTRSRSDDGSALAPLHARADLTVPAGAHLRALYSEHHVWLEPGVSVDEWIRARTVVALADTHLSGSIEADERILLVGTARFERLHAPLVQFGPDVPAFAAPAPHRRFEAGPTPGQCPTVAGTVALPEDSLLDGDLVATGDLHVGAGTRVRGSVRAGGALHLGRGAVVEGNAFATGALVLGSHAHVYGVAAGEADVYAGPGVRVGLPGQPSTLTGEHLRLSAGVVVYGTAWARAEGRLESLPTS